MSDPSDSQGARARRHAADPRGAAVPIPSTLHEVCVEHELVGGVSIMCVGTDLCRFCQHAKRRARQERAEAKAREHRRQRRATRQALRAGAEGLPPQKRRLPPPARLP
jgi:hypothetical protein